jgi:hypothetical protein
MPMVKVASWVFAVLMAACGVVYGAAGKKPSDKLAQWSSVEALPPDALIEVGREGQAGVDVCRIESADDSTLTCVSEHPEGDARLVFSARHGAERVVDGASEGSAYWTLDRGGCGDCGDCCGLCGGWDTGFRYRRRASSWCRVFLF